MAVRSSVASTYRVSAFSRVGAVLAVFATILLAFALLYQFGSHLTGSAPFPYEVSFAIAVGGPILSTALSVLAFVLRIIGRLRAGPPPKKHPTTAQRASKLPGIVQSIFNALNWLRRMIARFFIPGALIASTVISIAVELPRFPLQSFASQMWSNCGATLTHAEEQLQQAASTAQRDGDFHASPAQLATDMAPFAGSLDSDGDTARTQIAQLDSVTPPLSKYARLIALCKTELQIVARCIDPTKQPGSDAPCNPGSSSPLADGLENGASGLLHGAASSTPQAVASALTSIDNSLPDAPPAPALRCEYQQLQADLTSLSAPSDTDTCA